MTDTTVLKNKLDGRKCVLVLIIILIIGGFFMFAGADYGLPVVLHPDEKIIVEPALRMVENRTFEPDVFHRPDHLLIKINYLVYRAIALYHGIAAENIRVIDDEVFYLVARLVSGFFAMGSIIVAFLIGRRYSSIAGLISAFLFAVFPLYVTHAHYATADVPTVFFMLLFVFFALKYMQTPVLKYLILMAFATAAFITVKYPGAILLIMIAVSVIVSSIVDKKYLRILKHGIATIFFVLFFIFIISPMLILNFSDILKGVAYEARSTHLGADGLGMGGNMLFYLNTFLITGGIILFVFFVIGCYTLFKDRKTMYKHIPLLYGIIFWICLSYMPLHWDRWAFPMFVTPLLISAIGITKVCESARTIDKPLKQKKIVFTAFVVIACLAGVNLVTAAFGNMLEFLLPDTRIASQGFVEEKGINRDNTAYEGYTTLKPTNGGFIFYSFRMDVDPPKIAESNIEFIVVSSHMFGRINAERDRYPGEAAFYETLHSNFTEIKRFEPAKRNVTWFDPVNIVFNVSYLARSADIGMVGPTLIFYEVSEENLYQDPH